MIKIPINSNTPFNTNNNSLACSFENNSNLLQNNHKKIILSELFVKLENIVDDRNLYIRSKNPIKRVKSDELISQKENEK